MLGIGEAKTIEQREASGVWDVLFHDVRQTLGTPDVPDAVRRWAAQGGFLGAAWEALRSNLETRDFHEEAAHLREEAEAVARSLGALGAVGGVRLGESQAEQARRAVELEHERLPKLLVIAAALEIVLGGEVIAGDLGHDPGAADRGVPEDAPALDREPEDSDHGLVRHVFDEARDRLGLEAPGDLLRALAAWPSYLQEVWERLGPIAAGERFGRAADELHATAKSLARRLPRPVELGAEALTERGEDVEAVRDVTRRIAADLSTLVVVSALCALDWRAEPAGAARAVAADPLEVAGAELWRRHQAAQSFARVGPRLVSYVDEGDGPPVVLLHGMPTWGVVWHRVIGPLSRRARVLVPDLLGFSFSDRADSFDRSLAAQASAIDAWLEALGVERATFVGHDIGGGVAMRLAARTRTRVARLCLVDTVAYDAWPVRSMLDLADPVAGRALTPAALASLLGRALAPGFVHAPDDELVEALLAPWRSEAGVRSLVRNAAALDTNQTMELVPRLGTIVAPTIVVWGAEDPFLPVSIGERLVRDLPAARLVRVEGAGHFAMIDAPEALLEAVEELVGPLRTARAVRA